MTDSITGQPPAAKPPHGGTRCRTQGATGVSKHGTDMICDTAKDGHLRWQRQYPRTKGTRVRRAPQVAAISLPPEVLTGRPELGSADYQRLGNIHLDELRRQPNRAAGEAFLDELRKGPIGYITTIQHDLGQGSNERGFQGRSFADKKKLILDAVFGPEQAVTAADAPPDEAITQLADELRAERSVNVANGKLDNLSLGELEKLGDHLGLEPTGKRSKKDWRDAIVYHAVQAPGQFARALDIPRSELDERKAAATARLVQDLRQQTSSAAATHMLDKPMAELQDVARSVGIAGVSQFNKADLKREIVYHTVVGPRTLERAAGLVDPPPSRTTAQRVHDAYRQLAHTPGSDMVSLSRLRAHPALVGVAREEVDGALRELARAEGVAIVPESNQKALTDDDRQASVWLGNQNKHLILFESGYNG